MEAMSGGYAVEYICRIVDETDGQESIPESATMAQTNLNGKSGGDKGGKKGAKDAADTKTNINLNPALQVAMPVLNGLTDGVAGKVIGKGKQVYSLVSAAATGSVSGIIGAASSIAAMAIGEIVKAVQNEKAKNDALAESLDATNFQRQLAGMNKINYSRDGLMGRIRFEEER